MGSLLLIPTIRQPLILICCVENAVKVISSWHIHTHTKTHKHTPCIQYVHAAWIACQTWLLFILYEDILTHTYKSSWNQVYVRVLNEEAINVYWSLKQRSSLLWIGPEVMAVNLWKLKLPSSGCEAQTHSNARMNMVGVNILYMKHSI